MNGRRQDVPHNSDEQVREYVEKAVALADELTGKDDRWPVVFTGALGLYAAKSISIEQIQPGIPTMAIPGRL